MKILRTPDDRFENLPGYDFAPHYVEVDGLRVHYVDEGEGPTVLCMHGEPSWSYLYRHMIPVLVDGGCRAVAPDLVGFGRSDKPTERSDYSYARHVAWMSAWLEAVDLTDITLVCQDWGALIGLRLAAAYPERFARLVVANGGMPTGDGKTSEAFFNWQKFSQETPVFPVGGIINGGTATDLSPEVVAAYDAPFPEEEYKAGARQFPLLVPTSPDDPEAAANRDAWKVLESFTKPVLTAFSDSDPITKGGHRVFQERVPGAKDQPHTTIEGGGHFLQEDKGPELATVVLDFIRATS
jgi:haloalkane dehalogenase